MKRNKPRRQRHKRALKRQQLMIIHSRKWSFVRARGISDIVALTGVDALGDIALPTGYAAAWLAALSEVKGIVERRPS